MLAFCVTVAQALPSQIDASGLTDAQRAQIIQNVEALKEESNKPAAQAKTAAETAQVWVGLGKEIGIGLAETAKQLGVAANDFAQTPVGKWTAAIIIWNLVGKSLVHVGFAAFGFLVLLPAWYLAWRRAIFRVSREPTDKTWLFGVFRCYRYTYTDINGVDGNYIAVTVLGCLVIAGASLVSLFTI